MNCERVRDLLDQQVFETQAENQKEVNAHLEKCQDCNHYKDALTKKQNYIRLLSSTMPELTKPGDVTNQILKAIQEEKQNGSRVEKESKTLRTRLINQAVRWLAAASVILVFTFGFEQYHVLDKMQTLESNNQKMPEIRPGFLFRVDLTNFQKTELKELLDQSEKGKLNTKSMFTLLNRSEMTTKDLQNYPLYRKMFTRDLQYLLQSTHQLSEPSL